MNRIYLLIIAGLVFLTSVGQSPISLSNSNMPGSGDTLRYSNAKMNSIGNYTQTGANYNWNFSLLVPSGQGIRDFKTAVQTPYAVFFYGINEYGEKLADTVGANPFYFTNYYSYYKKQSSPAAFIADGVGLTYNSIPVPNYYSDKDELYKFPMSYPKYDSTTFKFSTASNTNIPVTYIKTGYRVTTVDGWGSITTPYGTANCLRLITTQYSQDTVKSQFTSFGFPNYQRSYQWMTTTSKIPFLEISGTLTGNNFTPTQARYRDSVRTIVGIKEQKYENSITMYPNPVKDKLCFSAINMPLSFEIIDLEGKPVKVQTATAMGDKVSLDVTCLCPGVYMIKVIQKDTFRYLRFIKE